jgi:hypothetical protein
MSRYIIPILMVISLGLLTGSDIECEFDGFPGRGWFYPYYGYDYVEVVDVYDVYYDPYYPWW